MKIALTLPGMDSPIDSNLPVGVPSGGLVRGSGILQTILELSLVIIVLIALYFIVQGGIDIIQSEGKKDKLNRGRQKVIYAIFGLIMVFLSFLFINAGSAFFGFNLGCIIFNLAACK